MPTPLTRRTKRFETRGKRKVRILVPRDADGNILGVFLPEEMKKIRKVSKLPAKAVVSNQQEEFRKTMNNAAKVPTNESSEILVPAPTLKGVWEVCYKC